MKDFGFTVLALYRALHPQVKTSRGAQAWFRHKLADAGIHVSKFTVSEWCNQGLPEGRKKSVGKVVQALHKEAHKEATRHLRRVEAIWPM